MWDLEYPSHTQTFSPTPLQSSAPPAVHSRDSPSHRIITNHSRNRSRPWLQNLDSVGPSPGPKYFYQGVHRRSIRSLQPTRHSATSLDPADSQHSSDSLSGPSQHAEHKITSGTSVTRPSLHSVIEPNPEFIKLSSSARHGSHRVTAGAVVVFLRISLGRGDGCGVGKHSHVAGVIWRSRALSRVLGRDREMLLKE